jgi:hypothetical protein
MLSLRADSILRRMIRANDDYWDTDRATYEDELGAWRERATLTVTVAVAAPVTRSETLRSIRRPSRPARPARPQPLSQISTHGLLGRLRRHDRATSRESRTPPPTRRHSSLFNPAFVPAESGREPAY